MKDKVMVERQPRRCAWIAMSAFATLLPIQAMAATPTDGGSSDHKIFSISTAGGHTCALLENGSVWCWGQNDYGQLGNNSQKASFTPIPVQNLTSARKISSGLHFSCAVLNDRTVQCWGNNRSGELGIGTLRRALVPQSVEGLSDVLEISAGLFHACAVLQGGSVRCWGMNKDGQLGSGMTSDFSLPVQVKGIASAVAVALGEDRKSVV